ncbi:MAG TPA: outer membrane beta-barrel protein, partial [Ignavibacteria bacterium]|nr:outer membrane beta-barrel protein [Ignavibacteria bacterium]
MKNLISILLMVIVLFVCSHSVQSQFIDKFGIKAGAIYTGLSSPYDRNKTLTEIFEKQSNAGSLLSYDLGIFAELFNKPRFCVSMEVHYCVKGESNFNQVKLLSPDENHPGYYSYRGFSDRFQYLSLQVLPRWRFELNSSDKIYLFMGPKLDILLGNYNSDDLSGLNVKNYGSEIGFAAGIGNEVWELFYLELKYEHSFSSVYNIKYGGDTYGRKFSSISLLAG